MTKEWEQRFPSLGKYEQTSDATNEYNCYAFAVEEQDRWWDPTPVDIYYWPPGAPRDHSVATFVGIYGTYGYAVCADGSLEPDTEKIVIYVNHSGGTNHVARQLPDGRWTSKIGTDEDIAHAAPDSLAGEEYGSPLCFMSRPKRGK